jgi:3-oxoacyl-[acyl-carrier protein] reductase
MKAEPYSHVLLTGGSRGLGLALARHLAASGHRVTTVSRTISPELEQLTAGSAGRVVALEGDLAASRDVPSLVAAAERTAPCTTLVNCAAVADDALLISQRTTAIEQMIAVNLLAPILLSRAVARYLFVRRSGRIISVSSIAGRRALRGLAVYGATKAGVEQFTRQLAIELGPRGIAVNAVAPGFLDTEMSERLTAQQRSAIARRTPLGRAASLEEVCNVVAYLTVAPLSLTGQILTVDGGFSL